MSTLRHGMLVLVVLFGPMLVSAQSQDVPSAIDVYAGWQQPLARLRSDSVLAARRTGAPSLGLGGYLHSNRPVLWRVTAEVTLTRLETEQRRSSLSFVSPGTTTRHERPDYTLSVDAAKRVAAGQLFARAADLRVYTGAALRRIGTSAFLTTRQFACISEDLSCTAGADYRISIGPVWRAGVLASIQGAGVRTRVDFGYQLSRPWHVVQHDLRFGLRFGPG